jgi:hypothetical protein
MGATLLTVYASNLYILNDIINNPTVSNLEISMTSTELTDSDTSEISGISGDIDIYSDCKSDFDDEINEFVKEVANEYKEKNDNETAVAREEELIADKADEREYNED